MLLREVRIFVGRQIKKNWPNNALPQCDLINGRMRTAHAINLPVLFLRKQKIWANAHKTCESL